MKKNLNVGIIGFGRFGQFIAKKMVNYGFNIYATNRTNYSHIANKIGVNFIEDNFEKLEKKLDIIIISVSINSFEKILKSYPIEFWKNKIIVDVLSVKIYPQKKLKEYLDNIKCSILLTHPMFGPDSAKDNWNNKKFVWWLMDKNNNDDINKINIFLDFWKYQGCELIKMNPSDHDTLAADSQFLTHFIGRLLDLLNCKETNIDTDGYKSLLTIKNHTINDSWDLFSSIAKYNRIKETIKKIKVK